MGQQESDTRIKSPGGNKNGKNQQVGIRNANEGTIWKQKLKLWIRRNPE